MEISDYLKVAKKRLWILIGIPLVAAIVTTTFVYLQPREYKAVATVTAPALVGGSQTNQYSGTGGVKAFVANFQATALSPVVADKVATANSVTRKTVVNNTTVSQSGDSSVVTVTYRSSNKGKAQPIATGVASETMKFLFSTQVQVATAAVQKAQANVATATNAVTAFTAQHGPLVDRTYADLQSQIGQLQQQAISLDAQGESSGASAARQAAATKQAQLTALAPAVAQYQSLQTAQTNSTTALQTAQTALDSANAQYASADPTKTITVTESVAVSKRPMYVKALLVSIGAGLFLAVMIVLVLELLARRPKNELDGGAGNQPARQDHVSARS